MQTFDVNWLCPPRLRDWPKRGYREIWEIDHFLESVTYYTVRKLSAHNESHMLKIPRTLNNDKIYIQLVAKWFKLNFLWHQFLLPLSILNLLFVLEQSIRIIFVWKSLKFGTDTLVHNPSMWPGEKKLIKLILRNMITVGDSNWFHKTQPERQIWNC